MAVRVTVAVVIPWRPADDRQPILSWLLDRLHKQHPEFVPVLGVLPAGVPWCKAKAVQSAINAVPEAETIVVHDADVWANGLSRAVEVVRCDRAPWAVPHYFVHRLKYGPTQYVLAGGNIPLGPYERKAYVGVAGGGVTVVRRDVWDRCPLDACFTGWGQEDESWGTALRYLYGPPWRGVADLVHLWHEPQNRITSTFGSADSRHRYLRYVEAASQDDSTRMLELLDEGRTDGYAEIQVQPADGPAPNPDVPGVGESCATPALHRPSGTAQVRWR